MSAIFLIRHGQASFGTDQYDRLSPTGQIQAEILARYLLRIGQGIDAVYAGEMKRQIDTAEAVISCYREAGKVVPELKIRTEFNEYDSESILKAIVGKMSRDDPEMAKDAADLYRDKKSFQRIFEKVILRWINGKDHYPGITTWRDFRERVIGGMKRVMDENGPGKNTLVFTSGGPISAAFQMATGISDAATLRIVWQIVNTSVSAFVYNAEKISLTSFNNRSHLELERNGSLITYR